MTPLARFRAEFPHTADGIVYFNHAAVAPMCNRVRRRIEMFMNQAQREKIENIRDTLEQVELARGQFARLINAAPQRIALVKNTTDGLLVLARGFPWQAGDRIIVHRREFPSNVYPWYDLKPLGVEIDFLDSALGAVTPRDLEAVVTERTRLVAVSWVQYSSGYRNDLAALAEWCRQRRILLAVDGMQGLGALPFDLEAMPVDLLAAGTAKWMFGPQGVGFIYVSEDLQERLCPPHSGWFSREHVMAFHDLDQPLKKTAARYEFATHFSLGVWGVTGALELLLEAGQPAIRDQIYHLTDILVEGLLDSGYVVISNRSTGHKSGIVIASHPDASRNQAIFDYLTGLKVALSLRSNHLRFAPHFYNTEEEIERSLDLLKACR